MVEVVVDERCDEVVAVVVAFLHADRRLDLFVRPSFQCLQQRRTDVSGVVSRVCAEQSAMRRVRTLGKFSVNNCSG